MAIFREIQFLISVAKIILTTLNYSKNEKQIISKVVKT